MIIKKKYIIFLCVLAGFFLAGSIEARVFMVATYNVENFFDLSKDQHEYPEYVPGSRYGWNKKMLNIKATNIAKVIKDMGPDVLALQEIESKNALVFLQHRLRDIGSDYPFYVIADSKSTAVTCAVLSKFPIIDKKEIYVDMPKARNILKVTLDVEGSHFTIFVNHWKSRQGPESERMVYAQALKREIDRLALYTDFILTGDLNSNHNEYLRFKNSARLNNTGGRTGINHVLVTIKDNSMVNESIMMDQADSNRYLYNLWLEIDKKNRWSHRFSKYKNSLDHMIVSKGLYDNKGICYVDNSFNRFDPDYLFHNNRIYRWQRANNQKGKHLGKGYSDHLPIFACFSTKPFRADKKQSKCTLK
jgi:endonuclease/exonuclease/phosphatase family metal-dependent hydrolase